MSTAPLPEPLPARLLTRISHDPHDRRTGVAAAANGGADAGGPARQSGKMLPAFKVNIADVISFSVRKATRQDKKSGASAMQQMFVLQGSGTELAACPVNYGTAEKIEASIRAHPSVRGNVPPNAPVAAPQDTALTNLADQLSKLCELRDAGMLSPEEFDQAKAKLLG
jgi:Short C-terminal domain